jgi:hypothetical protein
MLCARVLVEHFKEVVVLERDGGPDEQGFRKGVPQARFAHGILRGGLDAMNAIFSRLRAGWAPVGRPCPDAARMSRK